MLWKKMLLCFLIISISFSAIGCSGNKKEIQRLFIVLALGVDSTPDDRIEVTMQLLNPNVSGQQTGGVEGGSGKDVIVLSGIGDTFFDAVFQASKSMSQVQHFGHTKYIVIGESLARKGIGNLVDSFIRIEEFRLNTPILITKGKASEIVKLQTPKSPIPAIVVENLFLRQEMIGYRPFSYMLDFENSLTSDTTSSVLAVINASKPTEDTPDKTFVIAGTAVFKKDKLAGYLTDKETRGLQWVNGKVEVGSVTFVSEEFGKVSCEIVKSSNKVKSIVDGDKITIEINIKVTSDVRRISAKIDPVKQPEILDRIGKEQSKAIKSEIELALNKSKDDLGLDIFGFGEAVHRSYPKEWKKVQKNWDSLYPNIEIKVNVNSTIRSTGLSNKSSK
ncbi:Ger(x)C family spore germination protein [Clostridium sp. YIM B02515]|uniref:Ger(X)C family spore germination protein n=1 Tax=Clostridium rhizosphaerae TaxID=2803861 RepID=A0ABS1TAR6_9CLOT|nr:Ger(x)C family spore germination protein [Clostridium rhizosphaerae]MBL4936453.1 Ger(x)C family spore germination protein [Clostridium rhizosphaerae]